METITMYTTLACPDCRRAKSFLAERGVAFREVRIEEHPEAEGQVRAANSGRAKVPTFEVGGRFFACSPFNALELSSELHIPLNK